MGIILFYLSIDCLRFFFIPSTIKMWNSLNNTIRNVDTLPKFKSELKKTDGTENHAIPKHYFYGSRKLNITFTQLRSAASCLNYDLF